MVLRPFKPHKHPTCTSLLGWRRLGLADDLRQVINSLIGTVLSFVLLLLVLSVETAAARNSALTFRYLVRVDLRGVFDLVLARTHIRLLACRLRRHAPADMDC